MRSMFLSAREAGRQLGLSKDTVLRAIWAGRLKARKIGSGKQRWYILPSDLNRWAIFDLPPRVPKR